MGSLYIHFILLIFYFYFSAATWAVDFSPNSKSVEEVLALIAEEHPEAKSLEYLMHSHKLHMEASGILPDPKIGVVYKNYPARNGYALNDRQLDTPTMTGVDVFGFSGISVFG